ncbi:porin family protein [Ulvibacterium sp.]|uniref:porin family protein n=1 Tax=Ulvibacterium sp. TaxID=2665914 RepID=UPI00262D23CF|nr:porin family protein [Ulvibacterium sp.]
MKKIAFLIVLFSFLSSQNTLAQIQGTSNIGADGTVAVKAGFNLSALGGDSRYDYGTKPGFHLGGLVEIPFSDVIILQPEVLLSFQGSGTFLEDDINLFYLNVPLIGKYNVWDNLFIEAGPQLSVLLSSNIDEDTYGTLVTPDKNTLDIGFAFGAGYRLDENFYFQLRFIPGFINVVKDFDSKNRVAQISASYFF